MVRHAGDQYTTNGVVSENSFLEDNSINYLLYHKGLNHVYLDTDCIYTVSILLQNKHDSSPLRA